MTTVGETISMRTYPKELEKRLLPCPFCGGKAEFHESKLYYDVYDVACTGCGARVTQGDDEGGYDIDEAFQAWQRRTK